MITINTSHYNDTAVSIIAAAMETAMVSLTNICRFNDGHPGYDKHCHDCKAKQGCRDITRAAIYITSKHVKK